MTQTAKKALVVDDSITMRSMLLATIRGEGFEVITAKDGVEALAAAGAGGFDLVVTDINMPNMDGIELIRQLRELQNFRFTPILVVTTEGGDNVKQAGRAAGASGWIVKPFEPETLSRAVRKVCNIG